MHDLLKEIDKYLHRLFDIGRSLTGDGNRETLEILQKIVPIEVKAYNSGKAVYDWTIPDEWNANDAWIKNADGKKIVDFSKSKIHLVGYSHSINKKLTFEQLKPHLHLHSKIPDAIPYRTSYYVKNWGYCVTEQQYNELSNSKGELHVCIDSEFNSNGSLNFGELLIPGNSKKEILISTYICHPSQANDNLSGFLLSAFLARKIMENKINNYSYRFVWVPETIGAIAYCESNESILKKINLGLVVTTVGGPGKFGYKQSLDSNHRINCIIEEVFKENLIDYIVYPFDINGSDERQYSSQGFGINMATISKDKYYEYDYYHSSKDDLSYVKPEFISESLDLYYQVLLKLNNEIYYKNLLPNCEPMLSKYDLYPEMGASRLPISNKYEELDVLRWILLLSDGNTSLGEISRKIDVDQSVLLQIAEELVRKKILIKV